MRTMIARKMVMESFRVCEDCHELREDCADDNLLCITELINVRKAMDVNYLEFLVGSLEKKPPFSPR